MPPVRFYFDPISPYAYLALRTLDAFLKTTVHKVSVSVHPVLFAGLLASTGQLGPAEIPAKVISLACFLSLS